jgi:hypothetical protein
MVDELSVLSEYGTLKPVGVILRRGVEKEGEYWRIMPNQTRI